MARSTRKQRNRIRRRKWELNFPTKRRDSMFTLSQTQVSALSGKPFYKKPDSRTRYTW